MIKGMQFKVRFLSLLVLWWYQDFQNSLPSSDAEMPDVQNLTSRLCLKDRYRDRKKQHIESDGQCVK